MIQDTEPKCDECGHILPLAGPCANCGTRPKGLHVYIAGSFRDRERVRQCMRAARARGLHVVHDWPAMIESVPGEDSDVPDDEARKHALADIEAIRGANVLWLLAPPEGQGRGSWVEWGIALERNTPIIASGEHVRGSIFTAVGERYDTDEDALEALMLYSREPDPYENATGDTYPAPGVWANPARKSGEPCVEGTRIPTWVIAGRYAAGESVLDLLADYPGLAEDRDKVEAALRYELKRLYETYEPEDEGDGDEDDEPDTTVEQHSEWLLSLRGRLAKAERAVTQMNGRITGAEEGRRAADAVLDDVLQGIDKLNERVGQIETGMQHNDKKIDDLVRGEVGARERLLKIEETLNGDSYGTGLVKRIEQLSRDVGQCERAVEDLTGTPAGKPLRERIEQLERDLAKLQQVECAYTKMPDDGGPSHRSALIAKTSNNSDRIDDLERRMSAVDSFGADALRETLREIGFEERLASLEGIAGSARALGHVEGVQGRGAPRPGRVERCPECGSNATERGSAADTAGQLWCHDCRAWRIPADPRPGGEGKVPPLPDTKDTGQTLSLSLSAMTPKERRPITYALVADDNALRERLDYLERAVARDDERFTKLQQNESGTRARLLTLERCLNGDEHGNTDGLVARVARLERGEDRGAAE